MPAGMIPAPLVPGNIDLGQRARLHVPTPGQPGMYSSVRSVSFTDEHGREVLVPTVIHINGAWHVVNYHQAWQHYLLTGQHLGIFRNSHDANIYADWLHREQAVTPAIGAQNRPVPRRRH